MKPVNTLILAGAGLLAALYIARKAAQAGTSAVQYASQKLDITSDQNFAYQGATAVVKSLTGDKNATLGTWLYEVTHPDENVITQPKSKAASAKSAEVPDQISSLIAVEYDILGNYTGTGYSR